jgi:hypothetical protein
LSERISGGPVPDVSWGRETKRRRVRVVVGVLPKFIEYFALL